MVSHCVLVCMVIEIAGLGIGNDYGLGQARAFDSITHMLESLAAKALKASFSHVHQERKCRFTSMSYLLPIGLTELTYKLLTKLLTKLHLLYIISQFVVRKC